jgi:hypothetical protein
VVGPSSRSIDRPVAGPSSRFRSVVPSSRAVRRSWGIRDGFRGFAQITKRVGKRMRPITLGRRLLPARMQARLLKVKGRGRREAAPRAHAGKGQLISAINSSSRQVAARLPPRSEH